MILQVAGFHQLLGESSQLGTPKWPTAFQERMNGNSQKIAFLESSYLEDHPYYSVINNHGDRKSPKDRVVGPLANGRTLWLINGGDPNHLHPLG